MEKEIASYLWNCFLNSVQHSLLFFIRLSSQGSLQISYLEGRLGKKLDLGSCDIPFTLDFHLLLVLTCS